MANRVTVTIRSHFYHILAEEEEGYIRQCADLVARELDRAMDGTTLSIDDGAVLAALNLADQFYKEKQVSDNLRAQLKQALDENTRIRRQGSGKKPYNVRIRIDELTEEQYESIVEKCASKIQNIDDLVKGNFPDDLKTLFTQKGAGLFPSMAKIHFSCSCPDYADMCKHVAAVLYGIGSRFDKDPLLFFKLRGVDTDRPIGNAIKDRIQSMIENAAKPSDRIMDDGDVAAVFGMEI